MTDEPDLRTIALTVEYEGTAFCGWQIQPNGPTVQEALETALAALTGEAGRVQGAGRTDSGVHAWGQVAHLRTTSTMAGSQFARALNAHLPKTISVRTSREVPPGFHARFSATGKVYRYLIENAPTRPVLERARRWWVSWTLDDTALHEAAARLVGTHDFTSFADAERGRGDQDNVRTVSRAVWQRDGTRLAFEVEGNGFLYKMVRVIVGTLVEVGRGAMPPAAIDRIRAARDRTAAGPTAPPQGLHLVRVLYPDEAFGDGQG